MYPPEFIEHLESLIQFLARMAGAIKVARHLIDVRSNGLEFPTDADQLNQYGFKGSILMIPDDLLLLENHPDKLSQRLAIGDFALVLQPVINPLRQAHANQ